MRYKIDWAWWRVITWVWYLPWPDSVNDAIFRYRENVAETFNARHGERFARARLQLAFAKFDQLMKH